MQLGRSGSDYLMRLGLSARYGNGVHTGDKTTNRYGARHG